MRACNRLTLVKTTTQTAMVDDTTDETSMETGRMIRWGLMYRGEIMLGIASLTPTYNDEGRTVDRRLG